MRESIHASEEGEENQTKVAKGEQVISGGEGEGTQGGGGVLKRRSQTV